MLEDGDPPRTLLARCSSGRRIEGEEELAAASFCCCFSTTSGMDAGGDDGDNASGEEDVGHVLNGLLRVRRVDVAGVALGEVA